MAPAESRCGGGGDEPRPERGRVPSGPGRCASADELDAWREAAPALPERGNRSPGAESDLGDRRGGRVALEARREGVQVEDFLARVPGERERRRRREEHVVVLALDHDHRRGQELLKVGGDGRRVVGADDAGALGQAGGR